MKRREEPAPVPPPRTPAKPQPAPAAGAAERLSVIWLRDTKGKPRPG